MKPCKCTYHGIERVEYYSKSCCENKNQAYLDNMLFKCELVEVGIWTWIKYMLGVL